MLSSVPQLFKQPLVQQVAEHIRKCSPDIGARISAQVLDEFLDILYSESSACSQSQSSGAANAANVTATTDAASNDKGAQSNNNVPPFSTGSDGVTSQLLIDFKGIEGEDKRQMPQTTELSGQEMTEDQLAPSSSSNGVNRSKQNCENDVPIEEHVSVNNHQQSNGGDPEATENCTPVSGT